MSFLTNWAAGRNTYHTCEMCEWCQSERTSSVFARTVGVTSQSSLLGSALLILLGVNFNLINADMRRDVQYHRWLSRSIRSALGCVSPLGTESEREQNKSPPPKNKCTAKLVPWCHSNTASQLLLLQPLAALCRMGSSDKTRCIKHAGLSDI